MSGRASCIRFFFAIVVSFENQRRLSESGTHTTSSSEIQPAEQNRENPLEVWGGEGEGGEDVCVYVVGTVPVAGSVVACTCCGEVASGGVVLGGGAPRRAVFEGR